MKIMWHFCVNIIVRGDNSWKMTFWRVKIISPLKNKIFRPVTNFKPCQPIELVKANTLVLI